MSNIIDRKLISEINQEQLDFIVELANNFLSILNIQDDKIKLKHIENIKIEMACKAIRDCND